MLLEEILSELENNTGKFPRQALEAAIAQRETITPKLLATLLECKDNLDNLLEKPAYILHIYSLYLLAQFREKLAYPVIIEFFSVPGDMAMDVTGDVVTEDLARILACVSHENIDLIKQLIENQQVNEFIRGAGLKSLVVLLVQGIISREQVIQCFEKLFSTLFENKTSGNQLEEELDYIWTDLAINSSMVAPIELQQYIERAFDEDLIEPFFFRRDDFNHYLQMGSEANLKKLSGDRHYSLVEDAIGEMEFWTCFETEKPKSMGNIAMEIEGFSPSLQKTKSQAKKKRKMQKQARKKNRSKKK